MGPIQNLLYPVHIIMICLSIVLPSRLVPQADSTLEGFLQKSGIPSNILRASHI